MTLPAHVLVLGGTRGVGRAFAARAAAAGATVSIIGRTAPAGEPPASVVYVAADLAQPDSLAPALATVAARGPVRAVACFQRYRGDGDAWSGEMSTSLGATRQVIEWLADGHAADAAAVVVMSSVAARFIATEQPVSYHVAKAALAQMVRYYAVNLGPQGIRVNAIASGTIVKEESKAFYASHPEIGALYQRVVPLGRMCSAEDIVDMAMFLVSEQSAFVTGQEIMVDGGLSLVWQEALARQIGMKQP